MQYQPDAQPAQNRDRQNPVPSQKLDTRLQARCVIGAVKLVLQKTDATAKAHGCKSSRDANRQSNEPKLQLAWATLPQNPPAIATGANQIVL